MCAYYVYYLFGFVLVGIMLIYIDPTFLSLFTIIDMCKDLKKDYKPLDRHTVTNRVPKIQALVCEVLITMMSIFHMAITSDHWTSKASTTFLAVTSHFINDEWEQVSLTLACSEHKGRTTAPDCEREILSVLKKYSINDSRVSAIVTDTENTMTAMGNLLKFDHHYCLAHELELVTVRYFIIV